MATPGPSQPWPSTPVPAIPRPPADKSVGAALVLTFFFGSLGLFYASVMGGLIMSMASLVAVVLSVATFGVGLVLFLLIWPLTMVWAAVSASSKHRNFEAWKAPCDGRGLPAMTSFSVDVERFPELMTKLQETLDKVRTAADEARSAVVVPPGTDPTSATVAEHMGSGLTSRHADANEGRQKCCTGIIEKAGSTLRSYFNTDQAGAQQYQAQGEG